MSVLTRMKNSHSEGFWLAKHKHTNIPTMMELFPPSSGMVLIDEHTATLGASLQGVGRGCRQRVLVESIN
jgi:hypothetical protein